GTGSTPRSFSVCRSRPDSRRTLALYAPAKPWSLVMIRTAARDGFSASWVNGWVTLVERLITASTARVSSRAYGSAERICCCALTIRDDAISSCARVILEMDCTEEIRRRTRRSCAAMGYYDSFSGFGTRRVMV